MIAQKTLENIDTHISDKAWIHKGAFYLDWDISAISLFLCVGEEHFSFWISKTDHDKNSNTAL